MKPILRVKNLVKSFGGLVAVNKCSFEVETGSITALIGPNGAGKTTMFNLINGVLKHDDGEIIFKETHLKNLDFDKRARLGIGRTFQAIRVFPQLSALENIMLGFPHYQDNFLDIFHPNKENEKQVRKEALELLQVVNLQDKANLAAGSLSYGQQKLIEIMRAVATGAELFLLDEPAAGVNRTLLHSIVALIKKLQKEGKTIMIVEHDMGFVMDVSDSVIVMDYGREIACGKPSEVQKNPRVLEAYLGVKTHA